MWSRAGQRSRPGSACSPGDPPTGWQDGPMALLTDDVRQFLTTGTRTGKLGWVASDGRPLVAPIWFVVEGDDLLFNTGTRTAKGIAIAGDPRCVLVVDLEEPPYGFVQ